MASTHTKRKLAPAGGIAPKTLAVVFVLVACASILGLVAWRASTTHAIALRNGRTATANIAGTVADHAHEVIADADSRLTTIVRLLEEDGPSDAALARLAGVMRAGIGVANRIRDIEAFDAAGHLVVSSRPIVLASRNAVAAPSLDYHRAHPEAGLHMLRPVRGRKSGLWLLRLSRRYNHPDGSFAGVTVATFELSSFLHLYAKLDLGRNGTVAMTDLNGIMLVRAPATPDVIGRDVAKSGFFLDASTSAESGTTQRRSQVDGIDRLGSFTQVPGFPAIVFVSLAVDDILADWQRDTETTVACAFAVCLLLGLFGWYLIVLMRRHAAAEETIRAGEAKYRLLADYGTDLVTMIDSDHCRTYVSPACLPLLGYTPEEMLGQRPTQLVHPEDLEALVDHLAIGARDGIAPSITYRVRHKDGSWIWLEALGRRVEGGSQVATLRDATKRKLAEIALHEANNKLMKMAMLDGLTGIGNRRCFDRTLVKESRRAARAELPLALLLMDADHFKAYNDLYGHTKGDDCLKSIAQIVLGCAVRPGDLLARYGGEEFALLLPETELAGAMHMAERICQAFREHCIPHGGNRGGMVTVSIGVAVVWPSPEGFDPLQLVSAADAQLYQAKGAGRNRACATIVSYVAGPVNGAEATASKS